MAFKGRRSAILRRLQLKEGEVQSFDRRHFRSKLSFIPYEQIEMFQHCIRRIENRKTNYVEEYRQIGNDVRGESHTVVIKPDDGNLYKLLESIHGQSMILEVVNDITIQQYQSDGHHGPAVIGYVRKDTTRQYK